MAQQHRPNQRGRAVPPARPPVPWDLSTYPRGLRNRKVLVDGVPRRSFLVREPNADGRHPQQAYLKVRGKELPPVGSPSQRGTTVCVVLPRDAESPNEVVFQEPPEEETTLVVVKRIRKVRNRALRGTELDPRVEVAAMQMLNNAENENNHHTIQILEVLEDDSHIYIVMPYMEGGDLFDYALERTLNERQVRNIFALLVANMEHVQDHHVCHRDVKGENVLVADANATQTTLIDFATSLRVPRSNPNYHLIQGRGTWGTTTYMAPEIYRNDDTFDGHGADIWSLGVVLFVLLTGQQLYGVPSNLDQSYRYWIFNDGFEANQDLQRYNREARALLKGMLNPNLAQRFTLEQVREHLDAW